MIMDIEQGGRDDPAAITGVTRPQPLSADAIRRKLRTQQIARELHVLDVVESTNLVLRQMAEAGAADGTVVIANEQRAGHGRAGQRWFSPPDVNLYLSVLLRPRIAVRAVPVFSFIAPLALVDVLQDERVTAAVRWPNDVLVERRKVAGTLTQAAAHDGQVEFVILGIGVNLNITRDDLRAGLGEDGPAAVSLREVVGHAVDRNAFAAALLNALDRWREIYTRRGPTTIVSAWQDRDVITGRRVQVGGDGEAYDGQAVGLDADGRLLVTDARGVVHHVVAAQIRLID